MKGSEQEEISAEIDAFVNITEECIKGKREEYYNCSTFLGSNVGDFKS